VSERHDAVVGRSFLKLGVGEALARLIAFAATVYLARLLGPGVYGVIVLAMAILLYASCITESGIDMLGVHDIARDRQRFDVLLPSYLGARLLVAVVLILLLAGAGLFFFPQPEGAVLAGYAFLLLPLALGARWVHLGLEQSGKAALARVLAEGLSATLMVVLIHGPGDVARAPLAQLLGESAGAFLLLRLLGKRRIELRMSLRLDTVLTLWRRSWPVVGHTLLGLLIFNSDFFFLRIYRDSATVGYYAVAYTLVSFFLNLGGSYELSLLPAITRLGKDPEQQRKLYGTAVAQAFTGAFPIAVGGFLLARPLMALVFGGGYAASATPLKILIWCVPIALFRNVAQTGLIAHARQDQLLRTAGWAAGVNLLLNALLIPLWGMAAAALITVLTEAVRTALAVRFAWQRGLALPAPRRFIRPLLSGALMAVVVAWLGANAVWLGIVAGAVVYLLALLLVGGMKLQRGALPQLTV
jgi:O-antigen/teichoic acid export membrane protein